MSGYSYRDGMLPKLRQFDVIVLGAGAAGLMCAATAGQRGRRVALLEHNGQPGRKILISGGGRCNFTNLHCGPGNFLSGNFHFSKSALAGYGPQDFLALVERYGIRWHEKTLGQLFCAGSARAILDMLLSECELGGVELVLNAHGIQVEGSAGSGYRVACSAGEFAAGALVVATGGLSIEKMGATGLAYELAAQFGLRVVAPRPGLVPLVLDGEEAGWKELAGVSAEVEVWVEGVGSPVRGPIRFREKMLMTHRGVSGPAVLQASSYWQAGDRLMVDFAPVQAGAAGLLQPMMRLGARRDLAAMKQTLREVLPQRLAGFLAEAVAPASWGNVALEACEQRLRRYALNPAGTEGFSKAEVTVGGVDTDGLQARTMEARSTPGLFLIGEAVDVTGWLGGFNFQWAWTSGVAAGRAV